MKYKIKQILLVLAAILNIAPAYCGGKAGRIVGGVALGVLTGGASLAITGTVGAAVATGAATATAVATGGQVPARAGITLNGENGQISTVDVDIGRRPDGSPIFSQHYDSTNRQNNQRSSRISSYMRKQEYRSFVLETPINGANKWTVTTQMYDNRLYDRAYSSTLDLFSKVGNAKEEVSDYDGFTRFSTFEPTSFAAEIAMKSFVFEETTLKWNFGIEYLNGQTYHRAWVDGIRDLMIPANQKLYVGAGDYKPTYGMPTSHQNISAASNLDYQLELTKSFTEGDRLKDITRWYTNASQMFDINKNMFGNRSDGFNMPSWYSTQYNVPYGERRKSKDISSYVNLIRNDSGWTSVKGIVAQATLFRYNAENLKENNSELYNNLMRLVDGYNRAALTSEIAISMGSAAVGNPTPLIGFVAKYALFSGIEMLAVRVSEYGADRLAEYCAAGDAAKFASYQKTLNFVIEFAMEHGITGAYNRKFAYAGAYGNSKGFNLRKSETTQYRTIVENKNKGARVVRSKEDAHQYMCMLKKRDKNWRFLAEDGQKKAYQNAMTREIRYPDYTHGEIESFEKIGNGKYSYKHRVLDSVTEEVLPKPRHDLPDWIKRALN